MKLNYKRTILVGFAFFLISAFWQAYDATIPVILTNKFGMSQGWSGVIMALDNILAVFMLPLFGALSDKCMTRSGKLTPIIRVGTIVAVAVLFALSFVDDSQRVNLAAVNQIDDPKGLYEIYETQCDKTLLTPEGEQFVLKDISTKDEFAEIRSDYIDPETGDVIRINRNTAKKISGEGYCFYKPFPTKSMSVKDFIKYMLKTFTKLSNAHFHSFPSGK